MANITPESILEIADTAGAKLQVDPSGPTGAYDLWTRTVNFGAPPPAFAKKGVFASTSTVSSGPLQMGGIFQARLFRKDEGPGGKLLGTLDFPVLAREARASHLTACADTPQVDITVGGTFASISFATNVKTMARVQLATSPPETATGGFPAFKPEEIVASVASLKPKVLHRVSLRDLLTDRETTNHRPLLSGATLFFTILAWTADGKWDFVWSTAGPTPPQTTPETIALKGRRVGVRLQTLYCTDDSDSSTYGEAQFRMIVRDSNGAESSVPYSWSPMATASFSPAIAPGTADVILMPPNAAGRVTVRVAAVEDDSGTPWDDDDSAGAGGASGFSLNFPAGEGKEEVASQVVNMESIPTGGDDVLAFGAQIVYSVRYL